MSRSQLVQGREEKARRQREQHVPLGSKRELGWGRLGAGGIGKARPARAPGRTPLIAFPKSTGWWLKGYQWGWLLSSAF